MTEGRSTPYREAVASLNTHFHGWVSEQKDHKPDKLWAPGAADYLRHASTLQREFANAGGAADGKAQDKPKPPGHSSPSLHLSVVPLQNCKVIHLIRHGEGFHNINIQHVDAQLTPTGWQQAAALGQHLRQHSGTLSVQAVIVSPLFRSLETAAGAFGHGLAKAGQAVLMAGQTDKHLKRVARPAVAAPPGIKFICIEGCRERLSTHPSDQRRHIKFAKAQFPAVDYSNIETEEDEVYAKHCPEGDAALQERGRLLLQYIMSRPETHVAVISHCQMLAYMLSSYGHECSLGTQIELRRSFENCELRTVVVSDIAARSRPKPLCFSGGKACLQAPKH